MVVGSSINSTNWATPNITRNGYMSTNSWRFIDHKNLMLNQRFWQTASNFHQASKVQERGLAQANARPFPLPEQAPLKRKQASSELNLDLSLSLKTNGKKTKAAYDHEEVDSSLSLLLFSASKERKNGDEVAAALDLSL